jgi:NADPH2 dehydrogenase
MSKLFSEYKIKDLVLKNRIVMPPMCMYSAAGDGLVADWHPIHYASRAIGGVGLIIVEATGICPEGRISGNDLGIWDDEHIPGLRSLVDLLHKHGAKVGLQINHGGRKCEAPGMDIEAPSPLPFDVESKVPREMTKQDITETVLEFQSAAARALAAGFDLLEIHAAHGYLLSEFLSPATNKRTDEYGGSQENRVRMLGEVLDAVTKVWPKEKPLEVRVSAEDYVEGGNQAEDLAYMLNLVKDKGIDMVNVSTGGVVPAPPKVFPGYQVSHAQIIGRQTGLPVTAGGLLTDPVHIESVLGDEKIELVFLGRELLRDPYWPLRAASALAYEMEWPKQYLRAKPR